jgi:hypothetical protein
VNLGFLGSGEANCTAVARPCPVHAGLVQFDHFVESTASGPGRVQGRNFINYVPQEREEE